MPPENLTDFMSERTPENQLDPQMRTFLNDVAASAAGRPDPFNSPVHVARDTIEKTLRPFAEGGPALASSSDGELALGARTIRLRHYRTPGAGGPLILYIHGGGWTWESPKTHDRMAREYATRSGLSVVMPDYSLAPEHPFPAALDECAGLLRELSHKATDWGSQAGVLVIGDSAGANLALSATMTLRDDPAMPKALLLNYGAYSRDFDRDSYRWIGASSLAPKSEHMKWFWQNYLGGREDPNWSIEPLLGSFERLPPMRLQVAQLDVLHDENVAIAHRAHEAGVEVDCHVYPGVTHGFLRAVGRVAVADQAFCDAANWILAQVSRLSHAARSRTCLASRSSSS